MRVPECMNMRKLKMKIFEFQTICKTLTIIRAEIEKMVLAFEFSGKKTVMKHSKETNTGLFEMSVMK